jgi:YHS domain-containing protein
MKTAGKFENIFEYGGEIYYFSTKEKMIEFKSNLTTNIANANNNWTTMDDR